MIHFVHVYKSVPIVIKRLTNVPEWCIINTESTRGAKKNTKSEETKMKNYKSVKHHEKSMGNLQNIDRRQNR